MWVEVIHKFVESGHLCRVKATATVSFFKSQFTLKLQFTILDAFKFPLHNYDMKMVISFR